MVTITVFSNGAEGSTIRGLPHFRYLYCFFPRCPKAIFPPLLPFMPRWAAGYAYAWGYSHAALVPLPYSHAVNIQILSPQYCEMRGAPSGKRSFPFLVGCSFGNNGCRFVSPLSLSDSPSAVLRPEGAQTGMVVVTLWAVRDGRANHFSVRQGRT